MHNYLDVMEQFLDTQRDVMTAFLGGGASLSTVSPELFAFPDFTPPDPEAPAPARERQFALVESVIHHEPGREIVFRRVMDEREDLYADDHTLGGRGVSHENPGQNGLPVVPMTVSLEAMCEAALLLAPGKVVVSIRNVRLYRWLPFDQKPTTLEVRAAVSTVDPGTGVVEVKADVRDLGNTFLPDGASKSASEAVIVVADRYPEPPGPLPFALTDEGWCKSGIEDLRRNMFHGPLFQMLRTLDRIGREGIEGTLEVQPRSGWFRSNPDPHLAIDPILLDSAMHILGAWHLEQPDWTGRILLPFEVQRIDYFGPTPEVGAWLFTRGHNEQESPRHYRHGLEVFDATGRLWLRMVGAGYWRFYLPFGHVNFFGPKDEYFLSRSSPEAVPLRDRGPARCHFLDPPVDLKQPVMRAAGVRVTMTPREQQVFWNWTGTDAELNDWFFGRLLAKDAVRAVWNAKHGEAMFPADMETEDVDGRPVCSPRGAAKSEPFPAVRVAFADGKVASFSAFAERIGIALAALPKNAPPEAALEAQQSAACAAVADALRVAVARCSLLSLDALTGAAVVGTGTDRFRVQTARLKDAVVATTLCETV
jgi:hypothetical protein